MKAANARRDRLMTRISRGKAWNGESAKGRGLCLSAPFKAVSLYCAACIVGTALTTNAALGCGDGRSVELLAPGTRLATQSTDECLRLPFPATRQLSCLLQRPTGGAPSEAAPAADGGGNGGGNGGGGGGGGSH